MQGSSLLSLSFYTNCDDENIHVHPFGCILMLIDFVVWMWIHKTERVFCRLHGESCLKRYISMVVLVCGVLLFLVGIQKRERESEIILCFFGEIRRILPSYKNVHSFVSQVKAAALSQSKHSISDYDYTILSCHRAN